MLDLLRAIVLGVVQGATEFLPISSSAHQRIVASVLGWQDAGAAFTAITQIGTELAVLVYFRHDLWRIARSWFGALRDPALRRTPDARMGWFIIVATIPIGILGYAFKHQIETGARNLFLIGGTLLVFGLVMGAADANATEERTTDELDTRSGILVGLAQSLALIPGVSRSGATISAGLLLGLTREAAARASFLLAIPAVLASGVFELVKLAGGESPGSDPWWGIALATVISFIVGYAVIAWFLRYLGHHTLRLFVGYRVIVGAFVLILAGASVIH